jgi:hypothetical protein
LLRKLAAGSSWLDSAGQDTLTAVANCVKDDVADYITDRHATYFARSLLALLSGTLSPTQSKSDGAVTANGLAAKIACIQHHSGSSILGDAGKAAEKQGTQQDNHAAVASAGWPAELVRAFAHVLMGEAFTAEAIVTLQRSTAASAFLQALAAALDGTCVC